MKIFAFAALLLLFAYQKSFSQKVNRDENMYIDRLASFAKLAGDIQYFSPTDACQDLLYKLGWMNVYAHGVRIASKVTEKEFADSLVAIFQPLEPSLSLIYNHDTICKAPSLKVYKSIISVQNRGLSLYSIEKPSFRSIRLNRRSALSDLYMSEGSPAKFTIPEHLINKTSKFRYSFHYKTKEDISVTFPNIEGQQDLIKLSAGIGTFTIEQPILSSQIFDIRINMDPLTDLYIQADSVVEIDGQNYLIKDLQNFKGDQSVQTVAIEIKGNDVPLYPERNEIGDTLKIELSKQLQVSFPLAVYGDEHHTYPLASYNRDVYPYNKGIIHKLGDSSSLDMDIRLSNILQIWNVFRISYVYNTFTERQQIALLKSTLKEVLQTQNTSDYNNVVAKFLAKYRDGHIYSRIVDLIPNDSHSAPISIQYIDGKIYAKTIHSAELKKIVLPGDELLEIDGVPTKKMIKELSQYKSGSANNVANFLQFKLLYGKQNSTVKLVFKDSRTAKLKTLEAVRRFAHDRRYLGASTLSRTDNRLLSPNTYYFNTSKSNLTDTLLQFINDSSKNIIFDMRGYITLDFENKNLMSKLISDTITQKIFFQYHILAPDKKSFKNLSQTSVPETNMPKAKMYFLADKSTISAAETFLDAIKFWKVGKIIGEPTAGANGTINHMFLPGGLQLAFSALKVLNSDGSIHHLVGVLPDYPVTYSVENLKADEDPFIQKALSLINESY